jgi:5-methylcytosine-specific restriction endonuclease McrA
MPQIERDVRICRRDKFTCQYCGYLADTFERWRYLAIDHFVPRSLGGTDSDDNLKTACMDCNFMKSNYRFPDLETAQKEIGAWVDGERRDYERHFARS